MQRDDEEVIDRTGKGSRRVATHRKGNFRAFQSLMERKQRRTKCMEDRLRLGQFVMERRGAHFEEIWHDGYAIVEVDKKLAAINTEREEIARASQLLRKRKPSTATGVSSTVSSGSVASPASSGSSKKQQSSSLGIVSQVSAAAPIVVVAAAAAGASASDEFVKPEPPKE